MNAAMCADRIQLADGPIITIHKAQARTEVLDEERSKRAMNAMDSETKLIHARLEEWARWVKRFLGAQGYPAESYYHKWALLGIAPNPGAEHQLPDRQAHVDAAVSRLGVIDKSVVVRYYLHWRPVKIWKEIPGIRNKDHFHTVLKRARWRVDGYLSAIERV